MNDPAVANNWRARRGSLGQIDGCDRDAMKLNFHQLNVYSLDHYSLGRLHGRHASVREVG
jgi:hypothetical protein